MSVSIERPLHPKVALTMAALTMVALMLPNSNSPPIVCHFAFLKEPTFGAMK